MYTGSDEAQLPVLVLPSVQMCWLQGLRLKLPALQRADSGLGLKSWSRASEVSPHRCWSVPCWSGEVVNAAVWSDTAFEVKLEQEG